MGQRNMIREKQKAFAYITKGTSLLILIHPDHPEAGIQVPAGAIEPGESPAEAVMREAYEETGLDGLVLAGFLGDCRRDMSDYFDFRWVRLPDEIPDFIADHGQMVGRLLEQLRIGGTMGST